MNSTLACKTAASTSIRFANVDRKLSRKLAIPALLAILCAIGVSVHAQTVSFNGSTITINSTFAGPMGITTDASGNVFIADNDSATETATVYELMRTGPGTYGTPAALPGPVGGYICPAAITEPDPCLRGLAIDSKGNLWIAAYGNYPTKPGQLYELASVSGAFAANARAVGAGWEGPWGITVDPSGNVFVSDNIANTISEITSTSISSGTPAVTPLVAIGIVSQPRGIAVDPSDNLFVVDGNLGQIMTLTPPYTSDSSVNPNSNLQGPGDLARDATGNLWVSEYDTGFVRELTASSSYDSVPGWGSGLNGPVSVWPDAYGNVLVTSNSLGAIEQIATQSVNIGTIAVGSTSGTQTLTFTFTGAANTTIQAPVVVTQGATGLDFADAGTGSCTTTNGNANPYAPQSTCTVDVTVKPKFAGTRFGAVEILDTSGNLLATAYIYGTGSAPQLVFPSNPATQTLGGGFNGASGVAVDASGNAYVADSANNAVKKIPVGCTSASCVTPLGGGFNTPVGVAVDGIGNLYVADSDNSAVKELLPGCSSSACVATLGGGFHSPYGVAVDRSGNVYVSDYSNIEFNGSNGAIKEIPPGCTSSSCVITLAKVNYPLGMAVDGNGNLYFVNSDIHTIMEIPANCTSGCETNWGDFIGEDVAVDGSGNVYPGAAAVDARGNVYSNGANAVLESIRAAPPSLTFATTNIGSQSSDSPQAITLRNIGNLPLTFPAPATGQNPSISANFSLDPSTTCPEVLSSSSPGTLAAGSTCTLALDFIPAAAGQISGALSLTDNNLNASAATQSAGLSGAGQMIATTTTASNKTVAFSASSQAVTLSATVTSTTTGTVNSGTVTFSVFNGATQIGSSTAAASVSNGAASANYTLPAGTPAATYTIHAVYSGATDFTGSTDTTHTLTVTAPVSAPVATISPSRIDFGTLYLGSIVTKLVTLSNTGNAAMTISDPLLGIVSGGDSHEFITINLCPKSLAAGKSCTMTVTFLAGPLYSPQTATLNIADNAPGSPQSVPLTATVINPGAQFSASSLNFGTVKTNSASSTKSITVTSTGSTALSISKVAISGANAADFSESTTCSSANLNPKAACSINVTFKPTAKGSRTATLTVTDNTANTTQSIPLSGTGN